MVLSAVIVLAMVGGCGLLVRAEFAPRRLETLDPIEQRTGWIFPRETRILSAARAHLGLDVGIWAVLEMPREDVREVLMHPQTGQFASAEGEDGFPEACQHMADTYWIAAPEWISPLPPTFECYLGVSRFEPSSYDVREAIAEMGTGDSETATVYVFYTSY